ncbi:transposase [Schinkia azotoformans]|uniref:Transposase IS3/IS911 family protein n=1 Tax=Schinkia azotoformans LMG 9581 TaxID=1131731 RepID=K6DPN6_SCHAZ|nr:transposase [Schinkia azotoformans]EKN70299.1 transposase IS3/IS911 family protein [Schinkia azotoformans LMG 9581]MEC1641128.1 transposase [Schinkia azotoformans]MEC1947654.1 transposase [Schinkia azotoformans]
MAKKHISVEIKLKAVHRILEDHCPVAIVAKELGLHRDTVYRWVNAYKDKKEKGLINPRSITQSTSKEQASKIRELEKKLEEIEMENEILKKFQAFLKEKK